MNELVMQESPGREVEQMEMASIPGASSGGFDLAKR